MINSICRNLTRQYCSKKLLPILTLYSKSENCSLCDDAKEALMNHKEKFIFQEVDITASGHEVWFEKYKYDIPVIHINDVEIMRHRVFEKPLLEALDQAQNRMK